MKEKTTNPSSAQPPPIEAVVTTDGAGANRYDSRALFRGGQEILIDHRGHTYRLRITRQDKLILTK